MKFSFRTQTSIVLLSTCVAAGIAACGGSGSDDASDGSVLPSTAKGGAAGKGAGGTAGHSGAAGSGHLAGGSGGAAHGGASGQAGSGGKSGNTGAAGGHAGSAGASGASHGGASSGGHAGTGGSSAGGSNAGDGGAGGTSHGATLALVVSPPTASIEVINGVSTPAQLNARPVYADGTVGPPISDATWSLVPGDRATVSGTGLVTATGNVAGDATVTATWNGLSATGMVTVHITDTANGDGLAPTDVGMLDGASGGDPSAHWIYPYDQTVFPRGLAAPVLMWDGYVAGDKMKVSLISNSVSIAMYFAPSSGSITIPDAEWTKLTESGTGGQVTMTVSRLSGGAAYVLTTETWKLASGSLRGTVYFWSISTGRVMRIKPGAAAPDDFLAAAGVTDGCTTCHAVSANGAVLTIGGGTASGDSGASVFDLLGDTLVASGRGRPWAMLALTPNGAYAALNNAPLPGGPGLSGGLYDVGSSAKLSGTGADDTLFDMPAFAPDGSRLLYVDHNTQALTTMTYSESSGAPTLGGPTVLVNASGDPTNNAIAFPTVSPDAQSAVYHHGVLDTRLGLGDLYTANATTAGAETALDALNGATYPFFQGDRDRHRNYEPSFAPVAAGGYFWVVFTSRRTYGNLLTGPAEDDGTNPGVKQLWVAAFDQSPTPGVDPSHPAFWVSGQDPTTKNMRAFWALDPCKDDGLSCTVSSSCCGGVCLPSGVCGEPPGQTCQPVGSTCASATDCCGAAEGYQCINSHCTEPKP